MKCVACLLVAVMHGVEAKTPKAAAIIPGNSEPSDNANLHNAFFDKFDANRDGVISRDEVAHVLPSMVASADADDEPPSSAEEKVEGFMMVLDENSDGVGSRAEMASFTWGRSNPNPDPDPDPNPNPNPNPNQASFMKKMHDMDGHTDRLPSGTPGATRRQAQEQDPEDNEAEPTITLDNEAEDAPWGGDHDEL